MQELQGTEGTAGNVPRPHQTVNRAELLALVQFVGARAAAGRELHYILDSMYKANLGSG